MSASLSHCLTSSPHKSQYRTQPVIHMKRTQSFQNCKETDIPGYNDCPSFMYPGTLGSAPTGLVAQAVDRSGNTRVATAPPPAMKRQVSAKLSAKLNRTNGSTTPAAGSTAALSAVPLLDKDELCRRYEALVSGGSRLSEKEFAFYKKKVDLQWPLVVEQEGSRVALSEIFGNAGDARKVSELFQRWMLADVSVHSWCPSLRKLVENAEPGTWHQALVNE